MSLECALILYIVKRLKIIISSSKYLFYSADISISKLAPNDAASFCGAIKRMPRRLSYTVCHSSNAKMRQSACGPASVGESANLVLRRVADDPTRVELDSLPKLNRQTRLFTLDDSPLDLHLVQLFSLTAIFNNQALSTFYQATN